jgi:hypothetical protein
MLTHLTVSCVCLCVQGWVSQCNSDQVDVGDSATLVAYYVERAAVCVWLPTFLQYPPPTTAEFTCSYRQSIGVAKCLNMPEAPV